MFKDKYILNLLYAFHSILSVYIILSARKVNVISYFRGERVENIHMKINFIFF